VEESDVSNENRNAFRPGVKILWSNQPIAAVKIAMENQIALCMKMSPRTFGFFIAIGHMTTTTAALRIQPPMNPAMPSSPVVFTIMDAESNGNKEGTSEFMTRDLLHLVQGRAILSTVL
jgi:hypothetical protein